MAVLFLVLLLLEAVGAIENPYIGLLLFVTVPLLFVIGLLLIPIGGALVVDVGTRTGPSGRRSIFAIRTIAG